MSMAEMSGGQSAENDALQRAADRIEAELICCDVFERLHGKPSKDWTAEEQITYRYHSICYWGEAARRIVLDISDHARDLRAALGTDAEESQ